MRKNLKSFMSSLSRTNVLDSAISDLISYGGLGNDLNEPVSELNYFYICLFY